MLLDSPQVSGPVFTNTISLGIIIQCLLATIGLIIFMSKKVQRSDSDSKTLTKLAESQVTQGQTQAQLSATVALQQQMLETLQRGQQRVEEEHGARIRRMEDVVFVPAGGLRRLHD